jgi:hypothetical protein
MLDKSETRLTTRLLDRHFTGRGAVRFANEGI